MNIVEGDLLGTVKHGIIIQQVNAQGVMGSGFAKAVRDLYPKVWYHYSNSVLPNQPDQGAAYMGRLIMVRVLNPAIPRMDGGGDLWIANIVGQQFYGRDGKQYTSYEALNIGLRKLADTNHRMLGHPLPIHFPLIGSGLGGGSWPVIKDIIKNNLGEFDLTLWLQPGQSERQ